MFFACGIWCFSLADVSSVSPSSEQIDNAIYNAGRTRFAALHNFRYFRQLSNVI